MRLSVLCCTLAALSALCVTADGQTRCTFHQQTHLARFPERTVAAVPVELQVSVASLVNWSASPGNDGTMEVSLTVELSPRTTKSHSLVARYCTPDAAVLVAHCVRLTVACSSGERSPGGQVAHTAIARSVASTVEVFYLCSSSQAAQAQILRAVFRWDSSANSLLILQRSVTGSIPVGANDEGMPLTTWLSAAHSPLLVSMSQSYFLFADVPRVLGESGASLHPAFPLPVTGDSAHPQRLAGCWDPLLRVGAVIVTDSTNNTDFTLFWLPTTDYSEPLPLLVVSQTALGPLDTRRCHRYIGNYPLRSCSISVAMITDHGSYGNPVAEVVVEAADHLQCRSKGDSGTLYFRATAALSPDQRWHVTPFAEWHQTDSNALHERGEEAASKKLVCPVSGRPPAATVLCSQKCAAWVHAWWSSPGYLQGWVCRVLHFTPLELLCHGFTCAAMIAALTFLLR